MKLTYTILVQFVLVIKIKCEFSDSDNCTACIDFDNSTTEDNFYTRGLYGGSYYNQNAENPENIHYIHGTYQAPSRNYYPLHRYYRDNGSDETFDYYLGFGISKMTDDNFEYHNFHYYYHDLNRTISDNETISSDHVISCHPNATFLCPENSETVCLLNSTIYCMSRISAVVPCDNDSNLTCVQTTVPCVRACISVSHNFESISIPCLANIIIEDVYEDGKGMTLSTVGGTFVRVPALMREERTFCVIVIVDGIPKKKQS